MTTLAPLAMSQTKDELLKYLNMAPETYTMMAKEADIVYKWLTSGKRHLKKNCKRNPPYDWSDIVENSKDEAMRRIAQSGDKHTSYYWSLAQETEECPNWIARWFLYHKFRYRDGRNRNPARPDDGRHKHSSSSRQTHYGYNGYAEESEYYAQTPPYYPSSGPTTSGQTSQPYSYGYSSTGTSSASTSYAGYATPASYSGYDTSAYTQPTTSDAGAANAGGYYDPVRDVSR